jgi:F-box protein 11
MNDGVATYSAPATRRPWLRHLLVASAILIMIVHVSFLVLVYKYFAPDRAASYRGSGAVVISNSGNRQYKTINSAIAAAPTGATILVRAGVYREVVLIEKEITLIGDQGPHPPTIECSGGGCIQIVASKATVRNLTIRARMGWLERLMKYEQRPAAVVIVNSAAVIEDSDVSSNRGPGIVVSGTSSVPEFKNVRVHDCMLNGILFMNKSQGVVVDSDVYGNQWAGIRSEGDSNPIIRHSRIHGGKMAGILLDNGAATVEECEIFENEYAGVHARNGSSVSVRQTKSFKNKGNGIYVGERSFGKAESCEVSENKNSGIEVSNESDAQLLDIKVHHQEWGIVIWRKSTAVVEGATVYDNNTGLFVESGGKPVVRKSVFRSHIYSAIEIREGGEPTIETSQVYDGKTSGIYFRSGASGRVQDCAIFGNAMSNIIIADGSDPEVTRSRLSESGYAGVLVLDGGQGSVTDCQIFNNYLGVEIRNNSTLSVQNSTIKDNSHQGLVADSTSSGSVTRSTLVGNADGPWKIEPGSRLVRQGNTE